MASERLPLATHIRSEVRGDTRYYWPEATYDYVVDGKSFHGNRYAVRNDDSFFKSSSEETIQQLTASPVVTVYYDPSQPSSSLLRRGPPFWLATISGVLAIIGTATLVRAIKLFRGPGREAVAESAQIVKAI